MADVFSVQSDSEQGAHAALRLLCDALGLVPATLPVEMPGRARWIARAASPSLGWPSGPGGSGGGQSG